MGKASERLRTLMPEFRARKGMSLRSLREALDGYGLHMDAATISRLENGHRHIRLDEAVILCRCLEIPFDLIVDPKPGRPVVRTVTVYEFDETPTSNTGAAADGPGA